MAASVYRDDLWRRLPLEVPMALLLTLLALIAFHKFLAGGAYAPSQPKPIVMEVVELPPTAPPPAQAQPEATPAPPLVQQAPAPVAVPPAEAPPAPAQTPVVVEAPPPAAAAKPAVMTPPPAAHEAVAVPPPMPLPAAEAAPGAASPTVTRELEEVTREGLPGMVTAPLMRSRPLTAEQRKALEEIHHTGRDYATDESEKAPVRAAASKRTPPLTKEQWKKLDEIYHVGQDVNTLVEVEKGPLRAAASKRTAPLTKEEWAKLDRIYHVGRGGAFLPPEVQEAPLRGALSIKVGLDALAPDMQPGARPGMRSGMTAHAIEQPVPEIPAALQPSSGSVVAVARFHVAADGTAEVELAGLTPEPKLDQLLLEALRKWRFTPAYQAGRAVDSTLELRLTISAP